MGNGTQLTDITGVEVTYLPAKTARKGAERQTMHVKDQGGSGAQRADASQRAKRIHEWLGRRMTFERWIDAIGAKTVEEAIQAIEERRAASILPVEVSTTVSAAMDAIDARNDRLADPTPLTKEERLWINATPANPAPAVSGPF